MSTGPLYGIRGLLKYAPAGNAILDIEALDIAPNSLTAVVGPNGAGKSSLLKLLAFLDRPDEGIIEFHGTPVTGRAVIESRRGVTLVHQSPLLFRGTVYRNVAYGLKVRGTPREKWPSLVGEALEMVDMGGFADRNVRELSGGEAQRVAIARALVFKPEVVLMDEPTASVDQVRVEMVERVIRRICEDMGASAIFSTHNLAQAHRLTDNVVHLSLGRIIGHSVENVFSGVPEKDGEGFTICPVDGVAIRVTPKCEGHTRFWIPARRVRMAHPGFKDDNLNCFKGVVTRMEMRGQMARIRIEGDLTFRSEIDHADVDRLGVKLNRTMTVGFAPEDVEVVE